MHAQSERALGVISLEDATIEPRRDGFVLKHVHGWWGREYNIRADSTASKFQWINHVKARIRTCKTVRVFLMCVCVR